MLFKDDILHVASCQTCKHVRQQVNIGPQGQVIMPVCYHNNQLKVCDDYLDANLQHGDVGHYKSFDLWNAEESSFVAVKPESDFKFE